ncbi:MAG TPA: hypothetical protein VFW85_02265 [Gaiellaceae bacterium]|nr:hypothetical protein [Gaiellaceae bacterium]
MNDFPIAFAVHRHDPPGLEVRVNFGVYASRGATPAEIDKLAEWLLGEIGGVTIVAEDRHEIGSHTEASVHQVRIEVTDVPAELADRRALEEKLVARAEHWARLCAAERNLEATDV